MTSLPKKLPAAQRDRELIGYSMDMPIFRDEIKTGVNEFDELHRLFSSAATEKYFHANEAAIKPTDDEIRFAAEWFRRKQHEQLEQDRPIRRKRLAEIDEEVRNIKPGDPRHAALTREQSSLEWQLSDKDPELQEQATVEFAKWWLGRWKLQRHLYDKFGGGRIMWQQFGLEAYDAHHKWLETLEAAGEFKFVDPAVRERFYSYWTTYQGPFLFDDPQRVRDEFLAPQWVKPK